MRPDRLDTFSVRHPHTVHVGKVESRLTRCPMTDDVEFWNRDAKGLERPDLEQRCGDIIQEAFR